MRYVEAALGRRYKYLQELWTCRGAISYGSLFYFTSETGSIQHYLLSSQISKHGLPAPSSGILLRCDVVIVEGYPQARGQERPRQPPRPAVAIVRLRYVVQSFALRI